ERLGLQALADQLQKLPPLPRLECFQQVRRIGRVEVLHDRVDALDVALGQGLLDFPKEGLAQSWQLGLFLPPRLGRRHSEAAPALSVRGTGARLCASTAAMAQRLRSEEHTSELQSRENLVCRLLLEKK